MKTPATMPLATPQESGAHRAYLLVLDTHGHIEHCVPLAGTHARDAASMECIEGRKIWHVFETSRALKQSGTITLLAHQGAHVAATAPIIGGAGHFMLHFLRLPSHSDYPGRIAAFAVEKQGSMAGEYTDTPDAAPGHSDQMQMLGRCAAGVVHDINNLLGIVQGLGEMLRMQGTLDEVSRDRVNRILRATQRAQVLSRRTMNFAKAATMTRTPLDVANVIEEDIDLLRAAAPVNVDVVFRSEAARPRVCAAPIEIHQITMNLCLNAMEALKGTSGTVSLAVRGERNRLLIEVSDNGMGMSPQTRARLFEPFFTQGGGSAHYGIGLANVRQTVDSLGGEISVESEEGIGTTFRVLLPAAEFSNLYLFNPAARRAEAAAPAKRTAQNAIKRPIAARAVLQPCGQE